ncbi:protein PHLOEM PROTEIN 2-LIKE A1-like [Punica granatum]|uniref:Protein PHLOEM PROTEIN 2-LIKE A1-like n=1 Tax=Punica granatum TaxID=22663 RepID=A0A6P8DCF9_PUNGR|nr:protein PHLOEM PROTEIN 2-LIKE A1-like [Punica granatum]
MGNSQSDQVLAETDRKAKAESSQSQSQPQAIKPTAQVQPQKEAARTPRHEKQIVPPGDYKAILKEADTPLNKKNLSMKNMYDHHYSGIFLNQMKEKFWVEKSSSKKCFMLFARGLSITWADTPEYWHWKSVQEATPRDEIIEVAELLNVCWLGVHGKYEISRLSPETNYGVVFVIMQKDPAYGWDVPVNIRLILPDGTKRESRENLMERPGGDG